MTQARRTGGRRWPWVLVGALVVIGCGVWLTLSLAGRTGDGPSAEGDPSLSDSQSTPSGQESGSESGAADPSDGGGTAGSGGDSTEVPTEPAETVGFDPQAPRTSTSPPEAPAPTDGSGPELEPAEPAAVVEASNGVDVSLVRIESVEGVASAGGEIAGPALRVTVAVENKGDQSLDLEYVVVNTYWGEDRSPAGTIMQPGGSPFEGVLEPDAEAEGTYLFSVAEEDRSDVVITVDHQVGEPAVVFQGDLS